MFNGIPKLTRTQVKCNYAWSFDEVMTEKQASDLQCLAGFHVNGYGFYRYRVIGSVTHWESLNNCD